MFQAVSPPIIRSSKTVYTALGICQAWHIPNAVCTVFELLMMGGETAWNMYSIGSNKEYCITLHLVGYTWKNTLTMHGHVNVKDICVLLGYYSAYSGSYKRFGTTCRVQYSKIMQSKKNAGNTSSFRDLHAPITLLASTAFSENQSLSALLVILLHI
jgi:hypothetical protein